MGLRSTRFPAGRRRHRTRLALGDWLYLTTGRFPPHSLSVYRFIEFRVVLPGDQNAHFIIVLLGELVEVH